MLEGHFRRERAENYVKFLCAANAMASDANRTRLKPTFTTNFKRTRKRIVLGTNSGDSA